MGKEAQRKGGSVMDPSHVCIVGLRSGVRKDNSGTYLVLSMLVPASGRGSSGFSGIEMMVEPEVATSISAIPGIYRTHEAKRAFMGRLDTRIVDVELVQEGFPG